MKRMMSIFLTLDGSPGGLDGGIISTVHELGV